MELPFTSAQFLDVISQYNVAVWPAQVLLYGLAGLLIYWTACSSRRSDRWASAALAFLWAWMGVVYHWLFFTSINPAAWLFGAFFVIQALVFLGAGVVGNRLRFRFRGDAFGWTGAVFLGYALLLYPLLGAMAGHPFPEGPTFGLPCPTTIVTFGLLLWATRHIPLWIPAIPLAWSLIGTSAALQFGILEDYGLLAAGVLGTTVVFVKNRRQSQADPPEMVPV